MNARLQLGIVASLKGVCMFCFSQRSEMGTTVRDGWQCFSPVNGEKQENLFQASYPVASSTECTDLPTAPQRREQIPWCKTVYL